MVEEWREVVDDPDYEVSDLGRVRRARPGLSGRCKVGYVLKRGVNGQGHSSVKMTSGVRAVHRMVWEAFEEPLETGWCIVPLNGDRTDARLANLKRIRTGQWRHRVELPALQILDIVDQRRGGATWAELVAWYGLSVPTLRAIVRRHGS